MKNDQWGTNPKRQTSSSISQYRILNILFGKQFTMSSIAKAREIEYKAISNFKYKEDAGTLALLHKNGFGKSKLQIRLFRENRNSCIIAQTHKHIEETILPKLKEEGMKQDTDFVYYRPMEKVCSTYRNAPDDTKHKNDILRKLFMSAGKRHSEVIQCEDSNCPYKLQEWLYIRFPVLWQWMTW